MPNIPVIRIGGTEYNVKDTQARNDIATLGNNITALGNRTTELENGITALGNKTTALEDHISANDEYTGELISLFDSETPLSPIQTYNQVWYVPGIGNQSQDGWQMKVYSVTGGKAYHIKAENYNTSPAEGIVFIIGNNNLIKYYQDDIDKVIIIPDNADHIYINRNWRYSSEESIKVCEIVNDENGYVPYYNRIKDRPPKELIINYTAFGNATISGNIVTIAGQNGGLITNVFKATSNLCILEFEGISTAPVLAFQLKIIHNDDTIEYYIIGSIPQGSQTVKRITFDAANLTVYHDAKEYQLIVNSVNFPDVSTVTINKLSIYESSTLAQNPLYNSQFVPMMENVFAKTDSLENNINSISLTSNNTIGDANGTKYSLQVLTNGTIEAVSHIPTDVAVLGNSLVFGMNTPNDEHGAPFGMAATDNHKDWFYFVSQAILEKNSNCQFIKQHTASFEQSESTSQSDSYISTYSYVWTDRDLVIVQIGDNVNNAQRISMFAQKFPELIHSIRTLSPHARVLIIGAWFGTSSRDMMRNTAHKYGCIYKDLSDLCVSENFAVEGETVTYPDGTTTEMKAAWISHPGNNGMIKIAERVITALDM